MLRSLFSLLALSIALALAAPVASASTSEAIRHSRHVDRINTQRALVMSRKEQLKIEGLRRNPDFCAKYGCVGNN